MNTQFFASLKVAFVTLVSLVVVGCASSQPTRYVAVAGTGTNRVLVPVEQAQAPSNWRVWSSAPVSRNRVLAPTDPIPSDWVPANPVRGRSGSFTFGSRIQSSYSRGTDNSSIHYWDQNGPHTVVRQTTFDNGYYYVDPNPLPGVYRNHKDFEAAPAQPLQPIR